ncbi:hypothetical protein K458DRAFT_478933 [Lentithecium fluviatile CBS 122367]|uniref:Ribosomal protein bL31m N-terminal domain-containing protein n=1 Tax=Lentithecium fluviatile CBS 122367 TaxID=1168545 RepID=A0A6G1IVS2_9PLEO|nr:hypothetical protein K458DRAFT_478933 [Lentithecium fluviatile CBS 122367]
MATPIPSPTALRALRQSLSPLSHHTPSSLGQIRHATLLRRPKRPYTFTQLVTLSDGSTFLHRTTSPAPVYKSTKDGRNTPLWNPSSQRLLNIEEDEAGKLRAFREKFGRGWDAEGTGKEEDPADHLLDLISGRKAPVKKDNAANAVSGKPPVVETGKAKDKK